MHNCTMDPTAPTLPFYTDQTDFQEKISIWDFRDKNREGEFPLLVFFFFLFFNCKSKQETRHFQLIRNDRQWIEIVLS